MSPSVQVTVAAPGLNLNFGCWHVYAAEQARPEEPDSCFALRLAARLARSPSDTPRARPGCASSCRVSLHCHRDSMKPTCSESCHTRLCRGLTSNSKVTTELRSPKDRRAEPFAHYRDWACTAHRLGLGKGQTGGPGGRNALAAMPSESHARPATQQRMQTRGSILRDHGRSVAFAGYV
jgi:hypothetical protein